MHLDSVCDTSAIMRKTFQSKAIFTDQSVFACDRGTALYRLLLWLTARVDGWETRLRIPFNVVQRSAHKPLYHASMPGDGWRKSVSSSRRTLIAQYV